MKREQANVYGVLVLLLPFLLFAVALSAAAAQDTAVYPQQTVPGGDPQSGRAVIAAYGCGTCHTIPGVAGADATVGPPLIGLAKRSYIAGKLPNTPDNLVLWIQYPQEIDPGVAMPDLGVSEPAARDIAAYLYTLEDDRR